MEEDLTQKFKIYVEKFDMNDDKIYKKYVHSLRVMNFAKQIAENLNMDKHNINLALVIGILHDYGRFPQWQKYKTFSDINSVDHGDLAVDLLFDQNNIKNFYLNNEDYKQIYYAIKYHNKLAIPTSLDEKYILLCKVIRDADKLDNFNLLIENKLSFNEDNSEISDKVKNDFFLEKSIDIHDVRNQNDKIILILATIYDIQFKYSLNYIFDNRVIDRLYNNLSNKDKFKIYFDKLKEYVIQKIKK